MVAFCGGRGDDQRAVETAARPRCWQGRRLWWPLLARVWGAHQDASDA
jgi:hypothetical protein